MSISITANESSNIDLAPESTVAEIVQNVRTIIGTVKYSIPLDRNFGIDGNVVDMPIHQAQAHMTNEIFRAIRQYEPRVLLEGVTFSADISGKLIPTVEVTIREVS